jgi:radical SAM protein with 4Fe4S-binding SPASM domain
MRVNLITNGAARGPEIAGTLINAGLNSVQVSVEGTRREVHDAVTGVPGSFDRALHTVDAFREAGAYTHINTTLNQLNLEDALGIPALARRLGLERFSMNMMIPAGTGTLERELVVPYAEIGPWIDRIQRAARREGVEFMWYSPTPLCLFNPIARGLGNKGCAACDGLLSVAPNGDVLPCSSFDEPVGNLLTDGFDAVWFGARACSLRDKSFAHPACRVCEHFAACQGACPLYWREMGYEELPAAKTAVET